MNRSTVKINQPIVLGEFGQKQVTKSAPKQPNTGQATNHHNVLWDCPDVLLMVNQGPFQKGLKKTIYQT